MSFQDRLGGWMHRPNDDVNKDDIPWWMKYSARGLGAVSGALFILVGAINVITAMVSLGFSCMLSGILQMMAGFLIEVIEAPCCCLFVDYVQEASNYAENQPHWKKAALYMVLGALPTFLCFTLSAFLVGAMVFGTGILYGMMSIGRKGSLNEMSANAATLYSQRTQKFPSLSTMRSTLVSNAQPTAYSNPFDSPV